MFFQRISLLVLLTLLALPSVVPAEENLLSGTLRVIFANIFKPKSMSVSVIVNISGHEHFKFIQEVLDEVMRINKNIQVPVAINQYTASRFTYFNQAKLVFTDSAENVRIRMENVFCNNKIQTVSTKYIIILITQISMREILIEIHKIFDDLFNFYIVDVVVFVYAEDSLHMYTYKPYSSRHCSYTKPILLKRFKRVPEIIFYDDLYPIKTRNFYQCPMKVVLWNIPPFVTLTYQNNRIHVTGPDIGILEDLAKFLNFSIEVVRNDPPDLIGGEVLQNNTATGVFKMLMERKANLTIGCISCFSKRLQFTSGSMPYFLSEIIIVFKNSQKYTPFQLLLRPFRVTTWCFFLTILILKPLLKQLLFRNFKIPQSFLKLLKLQWLFLIFLLRSTYEGSMFKAIRNSPYQHLPQTIDEVVQQNYSLITDYALARILREITLLKSITRIVPGNSQDVLNSLDDLPLKTGVLSSDTFVATFMKTRLRNYSDYAIVREKVSNIMCCLFFPRLSFMASSVNLLLKQYGYCGIFNKYTKELGFERLPMTTDQLRNHYRSNLQTPLDFNFLKAIFECFAVMNSISVLVFLLELLSLRCKILRSMFKKIS